MRSKTPLPNKPDVETRFEKNHGKKIRYRIREQQDKESKQELKEYQHGKRVAGHS